MSQIRDMIFVSALEKHLGRALTEDEMDGQPFDVRLPDGRYREYCVPMLTFPYDLISRPEDLTVYEMQLNAS